MSSSWGPDLRGVPVRTRSDVQQRYDDEARVAAYFGSSTPVPEDDGAAGRSEVQNPRREDKRRARAYTADEDVDL